MKAAQLKLEIQELVLDGFAPADRYLIGEALGRELTQLFSQHDVPAWMNRSGEIARLDGGGFEVAMNAKSDAVGAQIARAVHRGLQR